MGSEKQTKKSVVFICSFFVSKQSEAEDSACAAAKTKLIGLFGRFDTSAKAPRLWCWFMQTGFGSETRRAVIFHSPMGLKCPLS